MANRTARRLTCAALAVLGVPVAVAGAVVQGGWFPGGLLLALAGTAALFYGGTRLTGNRSGAGAPASAWVVTVMALTMSRAEGDAIFPVGVGPYLYLMLGTLSGVICATLPGRPTG